MIPARSGQAERGSGTRVEQQDYVVNGDKVNNNDYKRDYDSSCNKLLTHRGGWSPMGNKGARPPRALPRNVPKLSASQAPTNLADFWCFGEKATRTGTSWKRLRQQLEGWESGGCC